MPKKVDVPNWLKLDNAAKIYPAAKSRRWTAIFRLSVTLFEYIDKAILLDALKTSIRRLPFFAYTLKKGFFWAYLDKNTNDPQIYDDACNPCIWPDELKSDNYLFKIRVHDKRIALETYHVLSDGTGAMHFLSTLVANYLKLKECTDIPSGGYVLDIKQKPLKEEWEDSFLKYARSAVRSRKELPAYRISGSPLPNGQLFITNARLKIENVKEQAKAYGCTINTFLCAVLLKALLSLQKEEGNFKKPVKLSVPVNLRSYYKSKTLRNFSSYFNIPIHPSYGEYSLEDLIKQVKAYTLLETSEQLINARMNTNVSAEKNRFLRIVPLFIKNPILKMMYNLTGERYFTITLSNLGLVKFPENMENCINRIDFIPGRSKQNKLGISVVGFKEHISINIVRTIEEPKLEQKFLTNFVKLGIPVLVESNRR